MEWYNKYNTFDLSDINENALKILSNRLSSSVIENKIEQIEIEYSNKLAEITKLCESKEQIEEIKSYNSLKILQKELEIIKLLTKYTLQNKIINQSFFTKCLEIMFDFSETLRNRLGQKPINLSKKLSEHQQITRCSYKFCSYQDTCVYNYGEKSKSQCYQDHFVHNMVSSDLKILLDYMKLTYDANSSGSMVALNNKEVLKTINTLSFVIGHMEGELRAKCLYVDEKDWETCHYVKLKKT